MHFLYVDKIRRITPHEIDGQVFLPSHEPFQYAAADGRAFVAAGAISEAIGQLASWQCLSRNGFSARPLFMFSKRIDVAAGVAPGVLLDLHATIHHDAEGTLCYSGEASVAGQTVMSVRQSHGFFVPLGDLEDPEGTRASFARLIAPSGAEATRPRDFAVNALIDEVLELRPRERVMVSRTMRPDEPFYKDHFPREPITPIVILCELIATATDLLFRSDGVTDVRPMLAAIVETKIRRCVKPGDRCVAIASVDGWNPRGGRVVGEIHVAGQRIMRTVNEYREDLGYLH